MDLPQEGIGPNRALLDLNLLGPMKPSIKLHTRTIQLGRSIVKIEGSCMGFNFQKYAFLSLKIDFG